ncbi:hypothetical protein EVAR_27755_1 [Eumeta japonica]|uniref:Uncharacterized protein n=1 Tax=Eumeta variegata TaxID=151549 RepID=A0A4C1VDY2_EUMVA|nr:hypothetical protein EVAR_27755_1 [Eumeta japonica]
MQRLVGAVSYVVDQMQGTWKRTIARNFRDVTLSRQRRVPECIILDIYIKTDGRVESVEDGERHRHVRDDGPRPAPVEVEVRRPELRTVLCHENAYYNRINAEVISVWYEKGKRRVNWKESQSYKRVAKRRHINSVTSAW